MDGWNTTFLLGPGLFSGANWPLVSGRVAGEPKEQVVNIITHRYVVLAA